MIHDDFKVSLKNTLGNVNYLNAFATWNNGILLLSEKLLYTEAPHCPCNYTY